MLRPSSIRSRSLLIVTVLGLALSALSLKTERAFMMSAGPAPVAPLFAGITVNTTVDEDNTGANCSLREAIVAANTNAAFGGCTAGAGDDIITFTVTGTITLNSALPNLSSSMEISGPGATQLTVSGNNSVRVFNVTVGSPGAVTFSGLTISNGNAGIDSGGGIRKDSTGAINVTNSIISGNSAGKVGGGIFNNAASGAINVTNSTIHGNSADVGGGIYNNVGTINVTNSTLSGNSADSGGGIFNNGTTTVTNSTLSGNSADSGAGIYNGSTGTMNLANSTLSGNSARSFGGGIYNSSTGVINVTNSTLSGNSASSNGGGIYNFGSGTVNVTNSTIHGNSAPFGGGILNINIGTINVTNSTLSGNSAPISGGGIHNNSTGAINVTNSTLSGNSGSVGGGIRNVTTGPVNLRNSIVALNTAIGRDVWGAMTSLGHNLIGTNGSSTGFTPGINNANGDLVGTNGAPLDPGLGSLTNNGGPTQTHALLPGSLAIDAGDNCVLTNTCSPALGFPLTTDQRGPGFARNINGTVDIGAFESGNPLPLVISRFRENGPGGVRDEFIEIFNPNSQTHTVSGSLGGYGVFASAGNGTNSNAVSIVCQIPNGTQILGRSYYLCTGAGYTLGNLGRNGGASGATATGDTTIGCGGLISGCIIDIPTDAGLALINVGSNSVTNTATGFSAAGVPPGSIAVLDSVGFGPYAAAAPAPGYPSLAGNFCEGGACLQPVGDASLLGTCTNPSGLFPVVAAAPACYGQSGQYELLRRQTAWNPALGSLHQDTYNSAGDFIFISPNPGPNTGLTLTGITGVTAVLGAAGPNNSSAPPDAPSTKLPRAPFDGDNQFAPGNASRETSLGGLLTDPDNNPFGTFTLRFRYTNNSGVAINGLRFEVNNLSTLCGAQTFTPTLGTGDGRNLSSSPDCGTGSFTAILKAINSTSEILVDSGGTPRFVNGTVLEDLSVSQAPTLPGPGPLSPKGGGIDSRFIINPSSGHTSVGDGVTGGVGNFATTIGTTDPTKVIRVRVKFGVVRSGRFVLLLVPMARNSPAP